MAVPSKLDKIMNRMTDVDLQSAGRTALIGIYGPPGVGKTTLLAGLAKRLAGPDGRWMHIDSKDGYESLHNIPSLLPDERWQYEEYGDLPTLAAGLKLPDSRRPERLQGINVVVLDELSSMSSLVLDTLLRERLSTKPEDIPDQTPTWDDYYPQKELVRKALEAFHDVPNLHVLCAMHAKEIIDSRKVKVMKPDFPDKLLGELQKLFHVTAYLTAETSQKDKQLVYTRTIQSQPSALVQAKSRVGGLPWRTDPRTFVRAIGEWADSGKIEEDLASAEVDTGLVPDEIPTDGAPLADNNDDEPVVVED